MSFVSGKVGKVSFDAAELKFSEYTIDINGELPDMSHFQAGGGQVLIDGVTINDITLTGPYDIGAMAIAQGKEYAIKLFVTDILSIDSTARVRSVRVDNKYVDAPRVTVSAASSKGTSFAAAIT